MDFTDMETSGETDVLPSDHGGGNSTSKLQEIQDTVDHKQFSAVDFINNLFPTKESLVELDPLIKELQLKIRRVDGEILAAVRKQSSSSSRSRCRAFLSPIAFPSRLVFPACPSSPSSALTGQVPA